MNIILKKPKLIIALIISIIVIIGIVFEIKSIILPFLLVTVIAIYIFLTKEALKNLTDCIYYLIMIAPLLSLIITAYIVENKYIEGDLLIVTVALVIYFAIWLLIVIFGEIKTVKLATLIIAQLATVAFLVVNMIVNFIPVDYFSSIFESFSKEDIDFLNNTLGFTQKEFTTIVLQLLLYPSLITALLTYIIAEIRSYLLEKKLKV